MQPSLALDLRQRDDHHHTQPGQRAQPGERIAKSRDLLALAERARAVVDRYFDRAIALTHQFDQQFVVEIEAVALERKAEQAVAPEDLEHGKGILQPLAEE